MNSNSTPVSATSDELDNFRKSLSQLQSPSAIERVVDWMGINEMDSLVYEVMETKNNDQGTFFRCDYKSDDINSHKNNDDSVLTSIFNKSVPILGTPNSIESKSTYEIPNKIQHQKTSSIGSDYSKTPFKRNSSLSVAPPSVESKKKELCSYLKLMTRGDKKKVFASQYRRSTRVQNLEKKMKTPTKNLFNDDEVYSEKSIKPTNRTELSEGVESIALQSFEDLNMVVDVSKYPFLVENIEKKVFNFVMPPDNVLKEFNDFTHWVEPYIRVHKRKNGIINVQNTNCKNDKIIENHFENRESKINISESNENHRKNKKLNRFKKKIKKKTIEGECHDEKEIHPSATDENEQRQNNTENIRNFSTNHKNGNKCIGLIQDEINSKGLPVDNFHENVSNIEEAVESSDLRNKENIKIRIDYELATSISNERRDSQPPTRESSFKSYEMDMPCLGFSREDREKSEELLSKFNLATSFINSVPEKKAYENHSKYNQSLIEDKNGDICLNQNDCRNPNKTKFSGKYLDKEDISYSSNTSGSHSSLPTDDSSSTNSTSISDNISQKNEMIRNTESISSIEITPRLVEVLPYHETSEVQTLHNLLKKQVKKARSTDVIHSVQDWDSDNSISEKQKFGTSRNNSHFISFSKENGLIQNALYVEFYLILIQEYAVSVWNQTALGNVLGAQNLWIFNGDTKRLILNKECTRKHSLEMTVSTENCVAYVELWTKEHKSDIRQGPVADVFAIVYFWSQKLNKMDKKVHQLENINGFSDDVQYVVLKSSLNIVVSWHSMIDDIKVTQVHVYTMAADFQKIVNVRAMSRVEHYVSSLHNIEDCEELLMGCGEHVITLWNIEHGYIVASIKLNDIKLSLLTLWAKCDRGILFTVQQCVDKELRLIAINGRSHSWKKLKSYKPPEGFERIQNVYIENGVLISFYEEGILCWKAQTGEQILEENHETDMKYFPSGKYVIMATEKSIFIRQALTHLLTAD